MRKTPLSTAGAALLAAIVATPLALANAATAPKPAITMSKARAIALKAYPGGKIANEELEKEGGGSGLRYSFDIKNGSATYEVGVDAMTGKVLEKASESPKDEAVEKANEANEKD
ncbi:MAG: peptidase M4 [Rhodopseudomonas sp.]|nr:peptidase M4 [Rhodopseudomonas sp.]